MKITMVLLLSCTISFCVYAEEKKSNNESLKNFGFNYGLGTSFISEGNFQPEVCFHAGIEYTLDENRKSLVGLRYNKLNYNIEYYLYFIDEEITIREDVDFDAVYLYYRLPLGNLALSLGPGLFFDNGITYFVPGISFGYLKNLGDIWGYEIASTTYCFNKGSAWFIYFYSGLWIRF
jgi:hypothetical protein